MPRGTVTSITGPAASPNKESLLPPARLTGSLPLEVCLRERRSTRAFAEAPISLADTGQLLWAAQGITAPGGLRTAPSARAVYPLQTYLAASQVESLPSGIYRYDPDFHHVTMVVRGDKRGSLVRTAFGQLIAGEAPMAILLTARYKRMVAEFGPRGIRLAHMEAGHVGQNICLQAAALGLGAIGLGVLNEAALQRALRLPADEEPIYLIAAGAKWTGKDCGE